MVNLKAKDPSFHSKRTLEMCEGCRGHGAMQRWPSLSVGGPIDFLGHVKAARETPVHLTPPTPARHSRQPPTSPPPSPHVYTHMFVYLENVYSIHIILYTQSQIRIVAGSWYLYKLSRNRTGLAASFLYSLWGDTHSSSLIIPHLLRPLLFQDYTFRFFKINTPFTVLYAVEFIFHNNRDNKPYFYKTITVFTNLLM